MCFDCVLVLCFVMGYVLQFGEMALKHKTIKRVHVLLQLVTALLT